MSGWSLKQDLSDSLDRWVFPDSICGKEEKRGVKEERERESTDGKCDRMCPLTLWRVARAYLSDDWGRLVWVNAAESRHKTHGKHNIILDHYTSWTYVCTVLRIERLSVGYRMRFGPLHLRNSFNEKRSLRQMPESRSGAVGNVNTAPSFGNEV